VAGPAIGPEASARHKMEHILIQIKRNLRNTFDIS